MPMPPPGQFSIRNYETRAHRAADVALRKGTDGASAFAEEGQGGPQEEEEEESLKGSGAQSLFAFPHLRVQ